MPYWEYCILTRLSAGLDTKWYVNRVYQHSETDLPEEVTADEFEQLNERFDALHASKVYPLLPAVLNVLGGEGWELIDDMQTGIAMVSGGEGLVFKRQLAGRPRAASKGAASKRAGASKRSAATKRR